MYKSGEQWQQSPPPSDFVRDHWAFPTGSRSKKYPNPGCMFSLKNLKENMDKLFSTFLYTIQRKFVFRSGNLYKTCLFYENFFYSYIYISTLVFYYIQMKMAHLPWPGPNMNFIQKVCDSLDTDDSGR